MKSARRYATELGCSIAIATKERKDHDERAEMMELIETSRAYEANIRMIQSQDQMVGSLVGRLLKQS